MHRMWAESHAEGAGLEDGVGEAARDVWGQPEQGLTMGGVTSARRNTGAGDDGQDIAGMLVEGGTRDVGTRDCKPRWTARAWTAV